MRQLNVEEDVADVQAFLRSGHSSIRLAGKRGL